MAVAPRSLHSALAIVEPVSAPDSMEGPAPTLKEALRSRSRSRAIAPMVTGPIGLDGKDVTTGVIRSTDRKVDAESANTHLRTSWSPSRSSRSLTSISNGSMVPESGSRHLLRTSAGDVADKSIHELITSAEVPVLRQIISLETRHQDNRSPRPTDRHVESPFTSFGKERAPEESQSAVDRILSIPDGENDAVSLIALYPFDVLHEEWLTFVAIQGFVERGVCGECQRRWLPGPWWYVESRT